jgi:hypothetical protein
VRNPWKRSGKNPLLGWMHSKRIELGYKTGHFIKISRQYRLIVNRSRTHIQIADTLLLLHPLTLQLLSTEIIKNRLLICIREDSSTLLSVYNAALLVRGFPPIWNISRVFSVYHVSRREVGGGGGARRPFPRK